MNTVTSEFGIVKRIEKISDAAWDLTVEAPQIAALGRAGQFVHMRAGAGFDPFLRRPLSMGPCAGSNLRLIFTVRGRGTQLLAAKQPGELVDIIGPLGNSFRLPEKDMVPILVGGGIGVVPLLLLDDQLPKEQERLFLLGLRSKGVAALPLQEIESREIQIATDDGSLGYKGTVVSLLSRLLPNFSKSKVVVYGCGPGVMMAALKRVCLETKLPAQVSLEVPMGCGVGACQSCAVPRADGSGYHLVCKDGPVFDINEVDLTPERLP